MIETGIAVVSETRIVMRNRNLVLEADNPAGPVSYTHLTLPTTVLV